MTPENEALPGRWALWAFAESKACKAPQECKVSKGTQGVQGIQGPPGAAGVARYKSFANKDLSTGALIGTFVLPAGQWWIHFAANARVNLPMLMLDGTHPAPDQVLITCYLEAPNIRISSLDTATARSQNGIGDTWTRVAADQLVDLGTSQTFSVKCEPWIAISAARSVNAVGRAKPKRPRCGRSTLL